MYQRVNDEEAFSWQERLRNEEEEENRRKAKEKIIQEELLKKAKSESFSQGARQVQRSV